MPVGDVMQRIMGTETPLAVIKDGQIIGQITKDDILRNLVDPRSAA
jgi:glycine betaine/proline transport system ATP-binding protein